MQKNSQYKYTLRKLSVGLTSVVIGLAISSVTATTVHADNEQTQTENQASDTIATDQANDQNTETKTEQQLTNTTETTNSTENKVEIEQKESTDTVSENLQDVKEDQLQEDPQKNPVENNAEETVATKIEAAEPKQKATSELIDSTIDKLSTIKYDVSDLREANGVVVNDQLKNWYLASDFQKVHDQLPTLVPQMLDHADNLDTAGQRVNDNAAAIMLGMSYINHYYNISFGEQDFLSKMMFDPKSLGSNLDSIDWLTSIGTLSYRDLFPVNNVKTFDEKIAPLLNTQSKLIPFLDDLRKKWAPGLSGDDWFRSNTGIHLVEVPSKEDPNLNVSLYSRLVNGNETQQTYILPLLSIKNDDMYIVSTLGMTVYGMYTPYIDVKYFKDPTAFQEQVKEVHKKLDLLANSWGDYMDFWYRISNEKVKKRLANTNISVWDTYNAKDASKKNGKFWQYKFDTVSPAMAEFFASVGEKYDAQGIGAAALYGTMVRYYVASVIDDYGGAGVLSHEMTHNLDKNIYLDGYHHRSGTGVELYAQGLLESAWKPNTGYYALNTVLNFENNSRTTNQSPERFQNREDLQEYMQGLFDITYLLDYAEAQAMVNKSAREKQLMYAQISYDSDKKADVVSGPISTEIAEKLKSIDDFIDNNIIARRGYNAGNYNSDSYVQISLYAPNYAGLQNANSVSGGITFKKTAFELLAAKGWEDGFISYVSDKYAQEAKKAGKSLSDTFILEKIFNGEYNNDYATFKKAMFKERIDKRNDFKPVTITLNNKNIQLNNWDDLQNLMQTTVNQELAQRAKGKGSNLINNLKVAVLAAEFKQTNDFKDSIFISTPEVVQKGETVGDGTNYDLPAYDLSKLQ